jgi:hypothetical protein
MVLEIRSLFPHGFGMLVTCRRGEILFREMGIAPSKTGFASIMDPKTREVYRVSFEQIFDYINMSIHTYMNHKTAACEAEVRGFRLYSLPWDETTTAAIAVLNALIASDRVLPPPPGMVHASADQNWRHMVYHTGVNSLVKKLRINNRIDMPPTLHAYA